MDIVVTCPKNKVDHFWEHKYPNPYGGLWYMKRIPKNIEINDAIYFLIKNEIVAMAYIDDVCFDHLLFDKIEKLKNKISMKGFRGFRYLKEKIK